MRCDLSPFKCFQDGGKIAHAQLKVWATAGSGKIKFVFVLWGVMRDVQFLLFSKFLLLKNYIYKKHVFPHKITFVTWVLTRRLCAVWCSSDIRKIPIFGGAEYQDFGRTPSEWWTNYDIWHTLLWRNRVRNSQKSALVGVIRLIENQVCQCFVSKGENTLGSCNGR